MKKIAYLINFIELILLAWVVVLFITKSELLRLNTPVLDNLNNLGDFFIFPQLIASSEENFPSHTYLSLIYILIASIYLNHLIFYYLETRPAIKTFKVSTFHPVSSFIWELVYSRIKPSIYFHPDVQNHAVLSVQKSEIQEFILKYINQDQAKIYFLIIFTFGFILLPYFSLDLLGPHENRLFSFWNVSLLMVYLQFKFIFEAAFLLLNLLITQET